MPDIPNYMIIIPGSVRTSYYTGEYFDPTGITIKVMCTNGNKKTITYYLFSPNTPLTISDTSVTFSYSESGVTVYGYLSITVVDPIRPTSLSIDTSNGQPFFALLFCVVNGFGFKMDSRLFPSR